MERNCSRLLPGMILSRRYKIEKLIKSDESYSTYSALDGSSDMLVSIVEYFPVDFVSRMTGSKEIIVCDDKKSQFDEGFNEFVARAKKLFAESGPVTLYDCIAENNTAYMILDADAGADPFISVSETKDVKRVKQHKRLPLWVKIFIPVLLIASILFVAARQTGLLELFELFSNKSKTVETVDQTQMSETETEPAEATVDADVLIMEGHSYACYSGYDTWEDAEAFCESLNGHLVVIESQRENDALYEFALMNGYDNVYIGYSDTAIEGDWQWVTGERSDYTNWNEGEPNGFTQSENYAVISVGGKWFDADFAPRYEGGEISFICEWDNPVSGRSSIGYDELPGSLVTDPSAPSETVVSSTDHPVLTAQMAEQAFENYFSSEYDSEDQCYWMPYTDDCTEETYVYFLRAYTGALVYYYADLNTGVVRSVSYMGTDLLGVSEGEFNLWDYLPEYGVVSPDSEALRLDDTQIYNVVMNRIDTAEASAPGSGYLIDSLGYWMGSEYLSFRRLTIDYSTGERESYVIDDYGLMMLHTDIPDSGFVQYDVIRSYPLITDIGESSEDIDLMVSNEISDGTHYGDLIAVSEDGEYALVTLGDRASFTPSEVAAMTVGYTLPLNVPGQPIVITGIGPNGEIELNNNNDYYYMQQSSDGNYYVYTTNDDNIIINRKTYLLHISNNLSFEESDMYLSLYGDSDYNAYISEHGLTGSPILDSLSFYCVRFSGSYGRSEESNGYLVIDVGVNVTTSDNEITSLFITWHP